MGKIFLFYIFAKTNGGENRQRAFFAIERPITAQTHQLNMKKYTCLLTLFALFFFLSILSSCSTPEQENVARDLALKKTQLPQGDLFAYERLAMNGEEKEYMDFLYAYMAVGDITDYSAPFYLKNVQSSLKAREEMPWGKDVPEKLFRHFVIPVRVNNEALDSSRWVFYNELKERVKGLTMEEAILEINHWCHEKVTYRPSDGRTHSPLASLNSAIGRCGEESVFAVVALRAMGIPARQVYTPRWAHTDDNHAWVEAWAGGKWHFIGACEPEPVLDLAWFNAPASRGMLMHTRVFGRYQDVEEIMSQSPNFTEINVIGNYASSATGKVKVVDRAGTPVEGARVEFKLYNYGEFYTVALKQSDKNGEATLTAGLGDMLVFASKDEHFGFVKYSFGKDSSLLVKLQYRPGEEMSFEEDMVPPAEKPRMPQVTPEQRAANNRRFLVEDSLRKAYEATFITHEEALSFAAANGYNPDEMAPFLVSSRGNHKVLCTFLASVPDSLKPRALWLLQVVSPKDLQDITPAILEDHLYNSRQGNWSDDDYKKYILNPRIGGEELTPYKHSLVEAIPSRLTSSFKANPLQLLSWCKDSIKIAPEINSVNIYISPMGVWRARVSDVRSRALFFVAVCRTLGIPAWRDEVDGRVYYKQPDGRRMEADFEAASFVEPHKGMVRATYTPTAANPDPLYYRHYTLSRFSNGTFELLNFPEDGSASWSGLLKRGTQVGSGYYALVTGTRLASGAVLSTLTFFNVPREGEVTIPLVMRESSDSLMVIGSFDSESLFLPLQGDTRQSILKAVGRGYFVLGLLEAGKEPTDHALRDIAACKQELEKWGRGIVLLFPDEKQAARFNKVDYPNLPKNIIWGIDKEGVIRSAIASEFKLQGEGRLPLLLIGDTFNRVVFFSQGYTIGLGEQLVKAVRGL